MTVLYVRWRGYHTIPRHYSVHGCHVPLLLLALVYKGDGLRLIHCAFDKSIRVTFSSHQLSQHSPDVYKVWSLRRICPPTFLHQRPYLVIHLIRALGTLTPGDNSTELRHVHDAFEWHCSIGKELPSQECEAVDVRGLVQRFAHEEFGRHPADCTPNSIGGRPSDVHGGRYLILYLRQAEISDEGFSGLAYENVRLGYKSMKLREWAFRDNSPL